ncbi:MAG: signal peptidase I [Candidatus Bathyarchaeia archaeon]
MTQTKGINPKTREVIKLLVLSALVISLSYCGWATLKLAWSTEHPILVVVSGSMIPTLNVGDIIFIKGVTPKEINVGTIMVFHSPKDYDTLIVHRVVEKIDKGGVTYFKTKGDYNRYIDSWEVPESHIVGVFTGRIPYVGVIVMRLREPAGTTFIIILIVILIVYEVYNSGVKRKPPTGETRVRHHRHHHLELRCFMSFNRGAPG